MSLNLAKLEDGQMPSEQADGPYQYCCLPSPTAIRLIELLPGKEPDPICCALSAVNIEDAPPFEALSYVWGDPKTPRPILCFNHDDISQPRNSTLQVTVNCWHALRRLRHGDQSRLIWIDAICINQEDLTERGQQVCLMGKLYRKAACVLVYLGHDGDQGPTSHVFKLFRQLAVKVASFPTGVLPSAFEDVEPSILLSFCKFFENPWFKRCWTMQEIGLAQCALLLCDGHELDWDVFFSVTCWIDKNQPLDTVNLDIPTHELVTSVSLYTAFARGGTSAFETPPDFLDVLSATRRREAGEPKDRIFAFLGHPTAVDKQGPLVVPYYAQWSWRVFYQFALTYLKRTDNLRILSAVDHGRDLPPADFPLSWVPWWNPSPYRSSFGMSTIYDASSGANESQTIRLGGKEFKDIDVDQVLEDSPLTEWEDLVMSSTATKESIERVRQRFQSNMANRYVSKIQSYMAHGRASDLSRLQSVWEQPDRLDLAWFRPAEANLSVRGLILDEVELVWPVLDRENFTGNSFSDGTDSKKHVLEVLYDHVAQLNGSGYTTRYEDTVLALSLTLVAGMHGSKRTKKDLDGHLRSFAAYREAIQRSPVLMSDTPQSQQLLRDANDAGEVAEGTSHGEPNHAFDWHQFMIDAVNACHHRRFFTTKSGFFGLGPESMLAQGLFCAIIFGARAPALLQRKEDEFHLVGEAYRLVGEAYVQGVMDGEAVEMWKRDELEAVDIQIF
jgi:hypothetical protein